MHASPAWVINVTLAIRKTTLADSLDWPGNSENLLTTFISVSDPEAPICLRIQSLVRAKKAKMSKNKNLKCGFKKPSLAKG